MSGLKQANIFVMDCGFFPQKVLVYVNQTDEEPNLEYMKFEINKFDNIFKHDIIEKLDELHFENSFAIKFAGPNKQVMLYIKNVPTTITELAIVSHEIFHCVEFACESVDTKHKKSTTEVFAYLLDYLLIQFYKAIRLEFTTYPQQSE